MIDMILDFMEGLVELFQTILIGAIIIVLFLTLPLWILPYEVYKAREDNKTDNKNYNKNG